MKRHNKLLISSFAILLISASANSAEVKQVFGAGLTYPIAEKDAMEEIRERAEAADVKAFVEKKKRADWGVWGGYPLPRATESRVRGFVPWYTLEFDIKGSKGEIIYPQGLTFNPLEHVQYPQRIVVFKLDQLEKITPLLKPNDMLIADSGDVVEAGRLSGTHIYILSSQLANRLGVQVAPSFIEQRGKQFQIKEIDLNNE